MTIELRDRGIKRLLFRKPQILHLGESVNLQFDQVLNDGTLSHGRELITALPQDRIEIEVRTCIHPVGHTQPLYGVEKFETSGRFIREYDQLGERSGKRLVWKPS